MFFYMIYVVLDVLFGGVINDFSIIVCSGTDSMPNETDLLLTGVEGSGLIEFEVCIRLLHMKWPIFLLFVL